MTSGPDPRELPGFWGSMVFRHAPIPRKGSGNPQQQQVLSKKYKCDFCLYSSDRLSNFKRHLLTHTNEE